MLAADHALQGGLDLWLKHFSASRPLQPLRRGEKRFFVDMETLPEVIRSTANGRVKRSCVLGIDGRSKLEVDLS